MKNQPLEPNIIYHVYNRGNNGERIFIEERNYEYFMQLYDKYISPIADTFAYCLMPNHFHFLIRIKENQERGSFEEPRSSDPISKQFATFFGTYSKAINKAYSRTGRLFEDRFKRKPVTNDRYFRTLVTYIHQNPQRHGLIDDFRDWPYSSFGALASHKQTKLAKDEVLDWFDNREGFLDFHQYTTDLKSIQSLIGGDG